VRKDDDGGVAGRGCCQLDILTVAPLWLVVSLLKSGEFLACSLGILFNKLLLRSADSRIDEFKEAAEAELLLAV
jgi:hypothetical protein